MNQLPLKYQKQIAKYLPIETEGLTLWPVTVEFWNEFRSCVPALEFMRQCLPVALLQIPLLDALFQLEIANSATEEDGGGEKLTLFSDTLYALCLALRLGPETDRNKLFEKQVFVLPDENDPIKIGKIVFQKGDGTILSVTPRQYERLRPILCAQNGVKIPDETENPELVYADRILRVQKAPKLEEDFPKMVSWCAVYSHAEEAEIYDWPLLKFLNRCEVMQRTLDYVVFGAGAASGFVKYEGGSPVPSPYYARSESIADRLLTSGTPEADEAVNAGMQNARKNNPNRKE